MSIRAARLLLLCLILAVTLSSCSGPAPAPSAAPATASGATANGATANGATASSATATRAATHTPAPTMTPFPTETPRSTATIAPTGTFTPAPSATATPDAALSEVKLLGMGWLKNYEMLLSFQFPGPVALDQYHVMLEEKDFTCQKLAKYPDRLYCIGPGAKVLTYAWIRIFPTGSTTPGFEMKRWIPYFDNDYSNQFLPPY